MIVGLSQSAEQVSWTALSGPKKFGVGGDQLCKWPPHGSFIPGTLQLIVEKILRELSTAQSQV